MPELPEVETIRRGLISRIKGKRITNIEVRVPKLFVGDIDRAIGASVKDIARYGKLLVVELDNDWLITIHLKMTGQLIWQGEKDQPAMINQSAMTDQSYKTEGVSMFIGGHPQKSYQQPLPHKHTHIIFTFEDTSCAEVSHSDRSNLFISHLYFNDLRKFGRITILPKDELQRQSFIQKLGPEPLDEKRFTLEYLHQKIQNRPKTPIKTFLLDQTNIAGLGNIYADEALFETGIMPDRPTGTLNDKEIKQLYLAINKVINLAIEHGGSTARDYVNIDGQAGTYLEIANVYHRTGLPCKRCGGVVERMKIGGRSSHFCRGCQR